MRCLHCRAPEGRRAVRGAAGIAGGLVQRTRLRGTIGRVVVYVFPFPFSFFISFFFFTFFFQHMGVLTYRCFRSVRSSVRTAVALAPMTPTTCRPAQCVAAAAIASWSRRSARDSCSACRPRVISHCWCCYYCYCYCYWQCWCWCWCWCCRCWHCCVIVVVVVVVVVFVIVCFVAVVLLFFFFYLFAVACWFVCFCCCIHCVVLTGSCDKCGGKGKVSRSVCSKCKGSKVHIGEQVLGPNELSLLSFSNALGSDYFR
jgi:hypothetical protein